jgi:hypothetical protein
MGNDRYVTSLFFEEKSMFVFETMTTKERSPARQLVIADEQII